MPMNELFLPVTAGAALAIGFGAVLLLFFSLKRELSRAGNRQVKIEEALETIDRRHRELAEKPEPPVETPRSGLSPGKRSQALEMHRRGQTPAEIAALLGVPRNEVELLVKVQRILLSKV